LQTIGKYEVLDVIGHGGMGLVYRARDNAIGRLVALKVMAPALAEQVELRERFLREARAAGNLQHPNIVVIHDLGEHEGAPYIAMEYLVGQPLDKALAAKALTTSAKLEAFAQICDGLHFAHENGVVHRDVKPANVILLAKGGAKLVDFGIARTSDARLTKTGIVVGTVAYMAPEQLKGKPVDARSDVFSAGAMLYEMLSGKLPFEGETTAETMMKILQDEPPELRPEGVIHPARLAAVVQRALAKDPAQRYQSAREFGRAVRDHLQEQNSAAAAATVVRGTVMPAPPAEPRVERAPPAPLPLARPAFVPPTEASSPPVSHRPPATPPASPVEGRRRMGSGMRPVIAMVIVLIALGLGSASPTGPAVSVQFRLVDDSKPSSKQIDWSKYVEASQGGPRFQLKGTDKWYVLKNDSIVDQSDIASAAAATNEDRHWLSLTFNATGAAKLKRASSESRGRQLAIVVDGELLEVGVITMELPKVFAVNGVTGPEAEDLAKRINSGRGTAGSTPGGDAQPAGPAVVTTKVNPKDGLTYVWIPAGTFQMGCSPGDSECSSNEKPAHAVTITKGFWMGQTEVTQAAYQRVIGTNPSHFHGDRLPVEEVSWDDANAYCSAVGMRLPTEAEWEYAARAGSTAARYGDLDAVAWYDKNSGNQTHEGGQQLPNAWHLYDMLGNVWEWVADWYDESYDGQSPSQDPRGPSKGFARALRGGSWRYGARFSRVSDRYRIQPGIRGVVGFRCVGE
jgi:serine/threonine protein kinase/formylglycine-generating enzyme required for sulfatase activity